MKRMILVILLLIASRRMTPQDLGLTSIPAYTRLIAVTTNLESTKLGRAVQKTLDLQEELKVLRNVYDVANQVYELLDNLINTNEIFNYVLSTYEEYLGAMEDMIISAPTLSQEETNYLVALMDAAAFNIHAGNSSEKRGVNNIAGGQFNTFSKMIGSLEGSDKISLIQLNKVLADLTYEIRNSYLTTKSCRRFVRAYIRRVEYNSGLYDLAQIQKQVDQKIAKYLNVE